MNPLGWGAWVSSWGDAHREESSAAALESAHAL